MVNTLNCTFNQNLLTADCYVQLHLGGRRAVLSGSADSFFKLTLKAKLSSYKSIYILELFNLTQTVVPAPTLTNLTP